MYSLPPPPGSIYQSNISIWADSTVVQFVFSDSPTGSEYPGSSSIYTSRTINSTWACDSYNVTGWDGSSADLEVANLGNVTVYQPLIRNALNVWVAANSKCEGNDRCQVVQAFEAFSTAPYYYKCNISMSLTYNDPLNVSYISDDMAQIATSAIAQTGFFDVDGKTGQAYPPESVWGLQPAGDADFLGSNMAIFSMGAIAGAAENNKYTSYQGNAPSPGVILQVGHQKLFYTILGAITATHLVFLWLVAYLANRVMVGPEGALSLALLLRPIADALDGVSNGEKNQAFKDAMKNTMVRYEKGRNGKWKLNMS